MTITGRIPLDNADVSQCMNIHLNVHNICGCLPVSENLMWYTCGGVCVSLWMLVKFEQPLDWPYRTMPEGRYGLESALWKVSSG